MLRLLGKTARRWPARLPAGWVPGAGERGAGSRPPEYAKQSHVRSCRLGTTAGALLFLGQSEAKEDGGGESKKETQPREDL